MSPEHPLRHALSISWDDLTIVPGFLVGRVIVYDDVTYRWASSVKTLSQAQSDRVYLCLCRTGPSDGRAYTILDPFPDHVHCLEAYWVL